MKTLLVTCVAVITMVAGYAVYSASTSAHAGAIAAQQTTANSVLDEALGG
jgi:hypothetical protein